MVNKVILIGRLGRDPEMRYTAGGTPVCNFTLATDEVFRDKGGETQKRTEWHRIVAWAKLAEQCSKLLGKGKLCYIEGRLQTRKWTDKEGQERYTTEIRADRMQMLGSRSGGSERMPSVDEERAPASGGAKKPAPAAKGAGNLEDMEDDIPF